MGNCHITDEKGDHIKDPADAPDAVLKDYEVTLYILAEVVISVSEEDEGAALKQAKAEWTRSDLTYVYNDWSVK